MGFFYIISENVTVIGKPSVT